MLFVEYFSFDYSCIKDIYREFFVIISHNQMRLLSYLYSKKEREKEYKNKIKIKFCKLVHKDIISSAI